MYAGIAHRVTRSSGAFTIEAVGSESNKPPPGRVRAEKAKVAHQGKDVFSTNSVDPQQQAELLDLKASLASEQSLATRGKKQPFSWKKLVKFFG